MNKQKQSKGNAVDAWLSIGDLAIPSSWPSVPNPFSDESHRATRQRALDLELITANEVRRFDRAQFALLTGYAYPDATLERFKVCNDWHSWLFLFDDQADEQTQFGKQPPTLREYMEACLVVLRKGVLRSDPTPLERFTLDIRTRMCDIASEAWLSRFADDVEDYLFKGTLQAAQNWVKGGVPDVPSYLIQRRYDSAVYTCQDLIEISEQGLELGDVLCDPTVQILRDLCAQVVGLSNDIFSYHKEVLVHRDPNNLLHALMTHRGISLEEAIHRGIELINVDVERFIVCEQKLCRRIEHDERLNAYLHGLKAWMRGNVLWSQQTGRYAVA
ncbi:MAG: terpene synthase family protein [Gammaproteobacteria bacterium]